MTEKDITKMTISEIDSFLETQKAKVKNATKSNEHPYSIGAKYLIRTVTMIYTGVLKQVYQNELVLTKVAWIPETERWADTCANGTFKEVEPYPEKAEVIIGKSAILDMFEVSWELPTKQK